jgi:hypothetical protein
MIEVAVVLLIMAIVAAFVVPQIISYMRAYKLGVGARNVATAVQRARFLATSNNTQAAIVVSEVNRIDIQQYDATDFSKSENKGVVILPDGVRITPPAPKTVAFDGRGVVTPMPREDAVFRIDGVNGYYIFVTVSPTGQVTVSDTRRQES